MSLHMSETEKINKRREEQKEKTWHVWQGRSGKEAAFIGKVMKTRKKATLPSVFPFWSGAGKNSHTLLDRTVKAMESVYSPWRKKASNAWETAVKLNVRILPTQSPGCSALTMSSTSSSSPHDCGSPCIRAKSTDFPQGGLTGDLSGHCLRHMELFFYKSRLKIRTTKFILLTISQWTV